MLNKQEGRVVTLSVNKNIYAKNEYRNPTPNQHAFKTGQIDADLCKANAGCVTM